MDQVALIPEDSTLTIEEGATLYVNGSLYVEGTIINYGNIIIADNGYMCVGKFDTYGKIDNYGTKGGGNFIIAKGGELEYTGCKNVLTIPLVTSVLASSRFSVLNGCLKNSGTFTVKGYTDTFTLADVTAGFCSKITVSVNDELQISVTSAETAAYK